MWVVGSRHVELAPQIVQIPAGLAARRAPCGCDYALGRPSLQSAQPDPEPLGGYAAGHVRLSHAIRIAQFSPVGFTSESLESTVLISGGQRVWADLGCWDVGWRQDG